MKGVCHSVSTISFAREIQPVSADILLPRLLGLFGEETDKEWSRGNYVSPMHQNFVDCGCHLLPWVHGDKALCCLPKFRDEGA